MKRRKLSLKQWVSEGPEPLFEVVVRTPGLTYWEGILYDAILDDHPVFRHTPQRNTPPTPLRVACAFAGQLNEARGLIRMRFVQDGCPVWSGIFGSNEQMVFCVRSSDEVFCPVDRDIIRRLDQTLTQWNLKTLVPVTQQDQRISFLN